MNAQISQMPARSDAMFSRLRTILGERTIKAVLLGVAVVLVLWFRRPDQFAAPYVWVEDGTVNLRDFLEHGWASLWHPINGYFSVPIKFVHALSMSLSFRWLPEISLVLTVLFTYAVLAVVAFAPTRLRWPFLCALGVLLIPTDAETFAVSLYVGWWGTLLALIPLVWNQESRHEGLRLGLLALGGLSSPLIVGLAPLYAIRAIALRRRNELIVAVLAAVLAAAQAIAMSKAAILPSAGMLNVDVAVVIGKFFGYYLIVAETFAKTGGTLYVGLALVAFVAASWWVYRRELGLAFLLLGMALVVAIVFSTARVSVDAIHPIFGGPRYFFFPYILLSWILLQLASLEHAGTRLVACMLLAASIRNMLDGGRRTHATLDWRAQVEACTSEPTYRIPVHFAGDSNNVWQVEMSGEECRRLVQRSLFDNKVIP